MILIKLRDCYKWSQIKISAYNKFAIGSLRWLYASSIVNESIKTIPSQFIFFKRTKTQIKPKPTNKTKLNEQKTTKATAFCAEKILRRRNVVILRFFLNWNCLDSLIYYTAGIKLVLHQWFINILIKSLLAAVLKMRICQTRN